LAGLDVHSIHCTRTGRRRVSCVQMWSTQVYAREHLASVQHVCGVRIVDVRGRRGGYPVAVSQDNDEHELGWTYVNVRQLDGDQSRSHSPGRGCRVQQAYGVVWTGRIDTAGGTNASRSFGACHACNRRMATLLIGMRTDTGEAVVHGGTDRRRRADLCP